MLIGKVIKRTVQVFAALGLLAMFGYPLAATWLEHHPEQQAVLGDAFSSVDRKASYITQAQQFFTGVSKGREALTESNRAEAENKTAAELERKETERRRFNLGEMSQQDY